MTTARMEAFSDGVIAIIITIMVLELKVPADYTWHALRETLLEILFYLLSFVFLGIYWNNHHHLLHAARHLNGVVLWANLHLLFWLSLVPFATTWIGHGRAGSLPAAAYGAVLLMAAIAWTILRRALIACQEPGGPLVRAVGTDVKGMVSTALYVAAIALAFVSPWMAYAIYVVVASMWLRPDRRIEATVTGEGERVKG